MRIIMLIAGLLGAVASAAAQPIPTEPIDLGQGRLVLGAEISATVSGEDPGFFNYTDYEYSSLRNVRAGVAARLRATRRVQLLGELRLDHGRTVQPFALYVRVRPWPERRFDIQAGRIPPTFGALARETYGTNLLIGTPLAYQYLTSLRADALPATVHDLIRMRGRGWRVTYPLGDRSAGGGLPLVNSLRWDTGVQVHGVSGMVEWTGGVTAGSLSNPRVRDDNGGRQFAGRLVVRPWTPLALGASAARGEYLDERLATAVPGGRVDDGVQRAWSADVEYSAGRALARAEVIRSRWTLPVALTGKGPEPLDATAVLVEARYRLWPGVQVAGRAEHLSFGTLATASGPVRWEAPVTRLEAGGSYTLIRNIVVKASWQRNTREGGRIRRLSLGALQVVYWF
jgi:hypothetical protein